MFSRMRPRCRFCALGLIAGLWSAAAADATPVGGWSIEPTPNPPGSLASGLLGVSCPRASACTAVGFSQADSGEYLALHESWDGSSWKIRPAAAGAGPGVLHGVSCTGPRACIAVGDTQPTAGSSVPLAERWNGRSWEVLPTPAGATSGVLYGVSCSSASACTAVGEQLTSAGADLPLVERWNGISWEIQPTPVPPGARFSVLGGVSCTSASTCTATGLYFGSASVPHTLAERWNGVTWEIQPTPNPVVESQVSLGAVSCPKLSACTAVGFSQTGPATIVTLAERWDGSSWQVQPTPNPAGAAFSSLSGVSCPTARTCTAVGSGAGPLAERWDGGSWQIQAIPTPAGATEDLNLAGVSCPTRHDCVAVGTYFTTTGAQLTLAEGFTSKPSP